MNVDQEKSHTILNFGCELTWREKETSKLGPSLFGFKIENWIDFCVYVFKQTVTFALGNSLSTNQNCRKKIFFLKTLHL